jgi:hypothetical protein
MIGPDKPMKMDATIEPRVTSPRLRQGYRI